MNNSRRQDNIFGISIITITFIAGFLFNNFTRSFSTNQPSEPSTKEECYIGHLCFSLHNGEKFIIDQDQYIDLIDNKIQGIGNNNLMLRRRLDTVPLQDEVANTPKYQLFLDFYNGDDKLIQTIAPHVYKKS